MKTNNTKNLNTLGIDLAKNIFQLHGANEQGKTILQKRLTRKKLMEFMVQLPKCLIGMEACGGAHYWARKFRELGHEVKLMPPQHVKPYVKSNKNDKADAEAICEAVQRPNMRFVAIKEIPSQDLQSLHRIRSRLVKQRTALSNEMRGLLSEYGIVLGKSINKLKQELPLILENADNELSMGMRYCFQDLLEELKGLEKKISHYENCLKQVHINDERCQRIEKIPGVGIITATAMIPAIGNGKAFKNGRHFSAHLGLVPRQHSSGGKETLLGISKRGDSYLRTLLIHGARSVIRHVGEKQDKQSEWIRKKVEKRGFNRACVALANKNARVIWKLLSTGQEYDPKHISKPNRKKAA